MRDRWVCHENRQQGSKLSFLGQYVWDFDVVFMQGTLKMGYQNVFICSFVVCRERDLIKLID